MCVHIYEYRAWNFLFAHERPVLRSLEGENDQNFPEPVNRCLIIPPFAHLRQTNKLKFGVEFLLQRIYTLWPATF